MLRNDLYQPWFANKDDWGFELLSGDFQGVVVQVEKVDITDDSSGQVKLDFHVIHRPEIVSEEEIKSEQFESVIETVVNDILLEALEIHKDEQNRNNNP